MHPVRNFEISDTDRCDITDFLLERVFGPKWLPAGVEEVHSIRSKQFLQCPATGPVAAAFETFKVNVVVLKVLEVDETNGRTLVPVKHGIDRLGQLSRTLFVDAVGIHPEMVNGEPARNIATRPDLLISFLCRSLIDVLPVLVADLFFSPSVRQNGVPRNLVTEILLEFKRPDVYQAHIAWESPRIIDGAQRCWDGQVWKCCEPQNWQ